MNIKTDLAVEMKEIYHDGKAEEVEIPGVAVKVENFDGYDITRVEVLNAEGEKIIGKPIGNYITIDSPEIRYGDDEHYKMISEALSNELHNLVLKRMNFEKTNTILITGLGNRDVTPDALGPKVVEKVEVTRHILKHMPEYLSEDTKALCAIAPGVLGTTGIETSEIIDGVVQNLKPDLIIAVDALASRRTERINTTIQICDTGINPGSGLGNNRKGLNEKTLGIPVISIGVPTVVDAATLANDAIDKVIDSLIDESKEKSKDFYSMLKDIDREEKYSIIQKVLSPYADENLVVTPKEIDESIENISFIIAEGINKAFLKDVVI